MTKCIIEERGSLVVEHRTLNQEVLGSIPSLGTALSGWPRTLENRENRENDEN